MRVLLSAYACEPGKGSEPGVGWRWAIEIARRGHDVTVLTRANNRANIEAGIADSRDFPANIKFVYYDLPAWMMKVKRRFGAVHLYYAIWQCGAYYYVKKITNQCRYDIVHHVTFGGVWHFSLLGNLKIPFVLGPIGGGETSPFWLRWKTSLYGGVCDTIRDILNSFSIYNVSFIVAMRKAYKIYAKTPATMALFPKKYHRKIQNNIEIGIDRLWHDYEDKIDHSHINERYSRIIYVGRYSYWKGMMIGLEGFAEARATNKRLTLTMVGKGPEERRWRKKAAQLGIDDAITWISWVDQQDLQKVYSSHGVLIFPSLHDSSGNVILESLAHGLPVVCLKLGGPGVIVDDSCGRAIETGHGDYSRLVKDFSQSLLDFTESPERWREASIRAEAATIKWSWAGRIEELGVY